MLVLRGVEIPEGVTGSFEVAVVRETRRTQIGTLTVLADHMADRKRRPVTLVLDISKAVPDLLAKEHRAAVRLFAKHETDQKAKPFILRAQSAEIRAERPRAK